MTRRPYATREDELDQLLRGKRSVDLFAVVRKGLRASVESYSIKRLEPLYGYVELCSDGVNQAADLISATASIPSLNFIPLTTFGNWF
jgi:predicted RecB family nuclease